MSEDWEPRGSCLLGPRVGRGLRQNAKKKGRAAPAIPPAVQRAARWEEPMGCSVDPEVEVVERGLGVVGVEVDGGLECVLGQERVAVEGDERWAEHGAHELPHGGA